MNIDERLEFLMRSTESLRASAQELRSRVAKQSPQAEIDGQDIRSRTRSQLDKLEAR